ARAGEPAAEVFARAARVAETNLAGARELYRVAALRFRQEAPARFEPGPGVCAAFGRETILPQLIEVLETAKP
ncbi:MAG TPA: hypothetical protein PKX23_09255, partial [Verrucomicrobiota bacterium]|nr:hypothetical protein [Verrucomicrobiota bacterium]